MLSIRFTRVGKTKQPYFRLIVVDKRKDPWGRYLELLGNYNPRSKETNLKTERIKYWLSVGAQTSATIRNLLIKEGLMEGKKARTVKISKTRQEKMKKVKEDETKAKADTQVKAELSSAKTEIEVIKVAAKVKEDETKAKADTQVKAELSSAKTEIEAIKVAAAETVKTETLVAETKTDLTENKAETPA